MAVKTTPNVPTADYVDLKPQGKLRIVVPLLKSGGFRLNLESQQVTGNTLSFSAADLIGYEVSHYLAQDRKNDKVRLAFVSAEATRDGKTTPEPKPPALPFPLPRQTGHIRLFYFVRVSESDHNMAIIASKRLDTLNLFTKQLKENPAVCASTKDLFCAWVPAGIAVRPEQP